MKEKSLRDTQIRSMHEMGEIKRAQELRVDEFSVQKLRESHDTIQRLTSQIQELQERMNPQDNFKKWNRITAGVLRFQSTCNDSRFSFHAEPRQTPTS